MKIELEKNEFIKIKNGVIELPSGTLFLRQKNSAQQQFDYMLGNLNLSSESIENFHKNMAMNIFLSQALKCLYHHIIFPTKAMAFLDEFLNIGIYLKPIVCKEHLNYKVYYPNLQDLRKNYFVKDGNHCSCRGYLAIIEPILNKLGYNFNDVQFSFIKTFRIGDLGQMYNSPPIEREYISGAIGHSRVKSYSNKASLEGNTGEIRLKFNPDAIYKQRLVLFGDSFFVGCLNILSAIFEEISYIRRPYIDNELANRLNPDIILTGNAERYLVNVPDSSDDIPYFLLLLNNNVKMQALGMEDIEALRMVFYSRSSSRYIKWKQSLYER
jgi:hypothetical protein